MGKKDKEKGKNVPETEAPHVAEAPAPEQTGTAETPNAAETAGAETAKAEAGYTLTAEEFKAAREHIEKLQKERDEAVSMLQRNQADFDNFRKRNASARADSFNEGVRSAVTTLLPMLDNFTMAVQTESASADAWRDGVKLVYRQFAETLGKLGVTEIETDGKFDPRIHNAVMQEKVEGRASGDILAVLQKGYRMGDAIIRHSMVKVAE